MRGAYEGELAAGKVAADAEEGGGYVRLRSLLHATKQN
jgi:hypothetical protein